MSAISEHSVADFYPQDVFCASVVDHTKLSLDELTFLLSEHAGDDDVGDYVDELVWIWWKMSFITSDKEPARPTKKVPRSVAAITGAPHSAAPAGNGEAAPGVDAAKSAPAPAPARA